jgi:histidinol-phosphate aminotransferase
LLKRRLSVIVPSHLGRHDLITIPIPSIKIIYPSDANFLLVKIKEAHKVYQTLIDKKVIVRDRSNVELCEDCLRITVGTNKENQVLVSQLKDIS